MKPLNPGIATLLVAVLLSACAAPTTPPPKTRQQLEADARAGKIPDNVSDPRPEMPGMGPLGMPMR
ncbi:MAG: hypothetical protein ACKVY0_07100 [Prosthecobacter sp.]|uniref:hypothetical protein n=1 Tax=Prosthecobacter sp. TaxID=1965333 RepID=UPI0038FDE3DD